MPTPVSFKEIKDYIRDREASEKIVPLDMHANMDMLGECWTLRFDKVVMYDTLQNQTEEHFFKASTALDPLIHQQLLQQYLSMSLPGVDVAVTVKPKFQTLLGIPLKIPFTNIGLRRDPNKVRDDQNSMLATAPAEVTVKLRNVTAVQSAHQIWEEINRAACLHSSNYTTEMGPGGAQAITVIADDVAPRNSRNPLRYLAQAASYLVPRSVAEVFPDSLLGVSRTKPYGAAHAQRVIDYPMFDSGIGATAANTTVVVGASAVILGALFVACKSGCGDSRSNGRSPGDSRWGFAMGLVSQPTFTNVVLSDMLISSHDRGLASFGSGYQSGLFFKQTTSLVATVANDGCCEHLPFATRAVIRKK